MPTLTITASNLNRFDPKSNISQWLVKSIQSQTYKDIEFLIADGGSDNYEEVKNYLENFNGPIPMRIVQHKVDMFSRSLLNNVGVRNARGPLVACTDCDIFFAKDFVATVMGVVGDRCMVESRTMYWKPPLAEKIYKGELDPLNDINSCKIGRIKKKTTAGAWECMSIGDWNKVRGFDERYKIWGSEDQDLLKRVKMAGVGVIWLGESLESIMVFHQPHPKKDIKNDLEWQEKNKKFLNNITTYRANPDGWGGML